MENIFIKNLKSVERENLRHIRASFFCYQLILKSAGVSTQIVTIITNHPFCSFFSVELMVVIEWMDEHYRNLLLL